MSNISTKTIIRTTSIAAVVAAAALCTTLLVATDASACGGGSFGDGRSFAGAGGYNLASRGSDAGRRLRRIHAHRRSRDSGHPETPAAKPAKNEPATPTNQSAAAATATPVSPAVAAAPAAATPVQPTAAAAPAQPATAPRAKAATCDGLLPNGCYLAKRKFSTSQGGAELRCTLVCD